MGGLPAWQWVKRVDMGKMKGARENRVDTIMPPRKAPRTRTTPATTTNTTSVTNAQLQAMIDQGVAVPLWQHVMLTEARMAKTAIIRERVSEGLNALLETKNKRTLDNNNQAQQQSPKRQNVAQAYAAGTGERKEYVGTLPLYNRFKLHHNGPCIVKCRNCQKIGYMTQDCRNPAAARNQRNLTCYECGNPGHYRSDCPELKNQNHGNQAEGTGAHGLVHALGGEANKDLNDIEDDISGITLERRSTLWQTGEAKPIILDPSMVMVKWLNLLLTSLSLPQELSRVHHTFHVSNLKKCYTDEPLAVPFNGFHIENKLHFIEERAEIMDRKVKRLKQSRIQIVKVRGNSGRGPEFT
ncbi:putative reverse transcriptase domain-containing protein [Tanacetum coccineum]